MTCDQTGAAKYILGPVEVEGSRISAASSGLQQTSQGLTTGEWAVNLEFDREGAREFRAVTERLISLQEPQNQFAIVLDGLVVSAPRTNQVISDGKAEITGSFTQESAQQLANQLKFGALPISFQVETEEQISALLGSEQLRSGLIAGLIGLILVVIFSLFQYRALGLVTVASLVVAGVITYLTILLLSWTQGYRLSLPGVAGLIIAVGVTADSFIVYFERIRDEVREGRSLVAAVETGWQRARRTIIVSDFINLLAAAVLYVLAVGGVRGFAFTLGLTTIIDLIVVVLFTHPMVAILARTKFFGNGHRLSGFNAEQLGRPDRVRRSRPGAAQGRRRHPDDDRRAARGRGRRAAGTAAPRRRAPWAGRRRRADGHRGRHGPRRVAEPDQGVLRWRSASRGSATTSTPASGRSTSSSGGGCGSASPPRSSCCPPWCSVCGASTPASSSAAARSSGSSSVADHRPDASPPTSSPPRSRGPSRPRVSVIGQDSIRVQTERLDDEQTDALRDQLAEGYGVTSSEITSSFVGASWGADITRKAVTGLVIFLVLVTIVMTLYFRAWQLAVAGLVALAHDLVLTAGVYSLSGFEVTPATVIGFLTILGFSLYDTVVVFDKVRENTAHIMSSTRRTYGEAVNLAVNQTLVRSINTTDRRACSRWPRSCSSAPCCWVRARCATSRSR